MFFFFNITLLSYRHDFPDLTFKKRRRPLEESDGQDNDGDVESESEGLNVQQKQVTDDGAPCDGNTGGEVGASVAESGDEGVTSGANVAETSGEGGTGGANVAETSGEGGTGGAKAATSGNNNEKGSAR